MAQLLDELFAARQLVNARHHQLGIVEGVTTRLFDHLAAEQGEVQAELLCHLVLPLLNQAARRHDEYSASIRAHQQLADQQARHDGLAGAWVVCQHVTQRLAGQHGFVDGRDLVRQWLHIGGVHRHHGVEQVRQADPVGLSGKLEVFSRSVKRPRPACNSKAQFGLVRAKQHPLTQAPFVRLEVDGDRVWPNLLGGDDTNGRSGLDALDDRVPFQLFKLKQRSFPDFCLMSLDVPKRHLGRLVVSFGGQSLSNRWLTL